MPIWKLYQHLPVGMFIFAFGAIVGSFINVVVHRVPAGMSVISPPSRCPTCGSRLAWHENLPIVGWLLVRGRCRHCGAPVSPQYMVIETLMACLFLGWYLACYAGGPRVPWWGEVGGPWWYANGVLRTFPAFIAHVFLMAGLVAMTAIDARTFTIPLKIPVVVTLVAFVAWAVQSFVPPWPTAAGLWPIPVTGWPSFAAAAGGMAGLFAALALLRAGVLRYSFADYNEYVQEGQVIGDYPHARREMGAELLFLLPIVAGAGAGVLASAWLPDTAPPVPIQALGGSFLGYLVGGGIVWAVRVLGTLGFGREAMGLGDVHVLAAVGAVLGWIDPIWVFLVAPFFGLSWAFVSMGISSLFKRKRRELPFGPHLAIATLVVLFGRPAFNWVQEHYLPVLPRPGLIGHGP